jgi:phage baseplate assembly protein gpV
MSTTDDGDLENLILRTVERWYASRYSERHGLVTSYDPDKYLAKVVFMPEGQESGWLPIETGHIGNGFGIAIGLTPGDGKETGDQVVVRYQEGDVESGKIVQRVHSDKEKPPRVESGEMVQWHEKGGKIFFKKDGSILIEDGHGASHTYDGKGNITKKAKNATDEIKEDRKTTIEGKRTDEVSGVWDANASYGAWPWLQDDDG